MGLLVDSRSRRPLSYKHQEIFFMALPSRSGQVCSHYRGFTITLRHVKIGRSPLDERLVRRRDLNLTRQNSHKKQTSMPPVGFKLTILACERPQTSDLGRAATGIGTPTRKFWIYKTGPKIPGECAMSWHCISLRLSLVKTGVGPLDYVGFITHLCTNTSRWNDIESD
jgi:hypothetical protein